MLFVFSYNSPDADPFSILQERGKEERGEMGHGTRARMHHKSGERVPLNLVVLVRDRQKGRGQLAGTWHVRRKGGAQGKQSTWQ